MERNQNSVKLSGYAGSDPVIVYFSEDKKMARMSLGVHEYFKNGTGELVEQTLWFSLVFWNAKVALVEQFVRKGAAVCVEGKLGAQHYTDKQGVKRYTTEIVVSTLELMPSL